MKISTKRALALSAGLLAFPLTLLAASPAQATTGVSIGGGGKLTVAASNVDNTIIVRTDGAFIVVTNPHDTMNAVTPGCTKPNAFTVRCPSAGVTNLQISTGDGRDWVENQTGLPARVFLNRGIDTYFGGSVRDTVFGDEGNDVLFGNGGNDELVGGPDVDRVEGGAGAADYCSAETAFTCEQF
ncbi:calcium-binding protein [Herbidospora mongoliensis]|uniref:calcium-binding protein n=1 Tax=Herbidospora mongoliensis TaxID=688067 RepID=UPI00082C455C|nr:calcium-binding protein [Herbidospora mongoliensis]